MNRLKVSGRRVNMKGKLLTLAVTMALYSFAASPVWAGGMLEAEQAKQTVKNNSEINVTADDFAYGMRNGEAGEAVVPDGFDRVTLNNYGTITAASVYGYQERSYSFGMCNAGANSSVNNYGTIISDSATAPGHIPPDEPYHPTHYASFGMYNQGVNSVMNNYGTITATASYDAVGMYNTGVNSIMNNYGTITAVSSYDAVTPASYDAFGMYNLNADSMMNNYGTISATASAFRSDANGMYNQGNNSVMNNYGTITALAPAYCAVGMCNVADNSSMNNYGIITSKTLGSYEAYGMWNEGYNSSLNNYGTMNLNSPLESYGFAVWTGTDNQVNNFGAIHAKTAELYVYGHGSAAVGTWATELRDFSGTQPFKVGPVSGPARDNGGTIDFNKAKLILRAGDDYDWGTGYSVAEGDMVENNSATINNFDKITFAADLPDFVALNRNGNKVSLTPSARGNAVERLTASAAMTGVDAARGVMEPLDRHLYRQRSINAAKGAWEPFFTPYYSRQSRDGGMDTNTYGIIGGADYQSSDATRWGLHVGYGIGKGDGGLYGSEADTRLAAYGVHAMHQLTDEAYLRGQVSYLHLSGDDHTYRLDSGSSLTGRSQDSGNGVYASLFYGRDYPKNATEKWNIEAGLTALHMNLDPDVRWELSGTAQNRYAMNIDDSYTATYATAMARWEKATKQERVSAGFGVKGKLSGGEIDLAMDGYGMGGCEESKLIGVAEFGYAREIADDQTLRLDLSYAYGAEEHNSAVQLNWVKQF